MRYRVAEADGHPVVSLAGELDLLSARPVCRLIARELATGRRVILDLGRVTFIDVAGASALLDADRRCRASGAQLVIRRPNHAVRRVLSLSGLDGALGIEPADSLNPSPDVVAILGEAVEGAIRISGALNGNAQLADSSGVLRIVAQRGFSRAFLDFFEIVDDGDSACGRAIATGEPVWVADVTRSPIFDGAPSLDVMLDAGSKAVASLPVHAPGGPLLAVISVHHASPTVWSRDQMRQLHAHARAAGSLLATQVA